jgi:hypothetical protein
MQIDATHAKVMLGTMGYACEALDHVAEVPKPAVEALHSAWDSMRQGQLQRWEMDLITTRLLEAVLDSSRGMTSLSQ